MTRNGVRIDDTFAEAFGMKATRLLITADRPAWARQAAISACGFATSVIGCGCEAAIETELDAGATPGRPPRGGGAAVRRVGVILLKLKLHHLLFYESFLFLFY